MNYEGIIYTEAIRQGMPVNLAFLIVAQSKHETANYTSNVFKTCKNAFGYKYVGQSLALSACTDSPEGNKYAKYASVQDSTKEICAWIRRRQNEGKFPANLATISNPAQYAQLLKNSGYYGDPVSVYTKGLTTWLKENITVSNIGGFLIAIGVFFCSLIKGEAFEFA